MKIQSLISIFLLCSINAWADEVIYSEDKPAIMVNPAHPQFTVKLVSNMTTGYAWFLKNYDKDLVQPLKHSVVSAANKKLIGAPGYELWVFQVKPSGFVVPQQTSVSFVYSRPWDANLDVKDIAFKISTQTAQSPQP